MPSLSQFRTVTRAIGEVRQLADSKSLVDAAIRSKLEEAVNAKDPAARALYRPNPSIGTPSVSTPSTELPIASNRVFQGVQEQQQLPQQQQKVFIGKQGTENLMNSDIDNAMNSIPNVNIYNAKGLEDLYQSIRKHTADITDAEFQYNKLKGKGFSDPIQEKMAAQDIYKKTGIVIGPEGRGRIEISDADAKLIINPGPKNVLGDLLDHPELYKAYPALKNVKIFADDNIPANNASVRNGSIFLSNKGYSNSDVVRTTLLHEVQHLIQSLEDFAVGGSPTLFKNVDATTAYNRYRNLSGEIEARDVEARSGLDINKINIQYTTMPAILKQRGELRRLGQTNMD